MGLVRPANPAPRALPGLKVEYYGTAAAMPFAISRDRKTVFGAANGRDAVLRQSADDGATWTTVNTFAEPVAGIQELDDGEALVATRNFAATPGYLYRSTGWSASRTAATWTKVLTTVGGNIDGAWSLGHQWTFGDDQIRANSSRVGIVNEYGAQTTSSGDQTTKATRAYVTSDYGATWTLALDLQARYPSVYPLHMHGSAYDPYWDRLWVLYGDGNDSPDGAAYAKILFSDDRGATWQPYPVPAEFQGMMGYQSTTIAILPDCIIIGSDNWPGYLRLTRKGFRQTGGVQQLTVFAPGTLALMLACRLHRNRRQAGAPLLAAHRSVYAGIASSVYISRDDGATLVPLWDDPALRGNYMGAYAAIGPTYNGKILLWVNPTGSDMGNGTHHLVRGELVVPDPNLLDGRFVATGDGTTTVFNVPHGLGATPSRYMVWPEKPAGTYTVTVTSTNIVVTFSAAPSNAAAIQFAWRAGI